jgi:hypothetical protein
MDHFRSLPLPIVITLTHSVVQRMLVENGHQINWKRCYIQDSPTKPLPSTGMGSSIVFPKGLMGHFMSDWSVCSRYLFISVRFTYHLCLLLLVITMNSEQHKVTDNYESNTQVKVRWTTWVAVESYTCRCQDCITPSIDSHSWIATSLK